MPPEDSTADLAIADDLHHELNEPAGTLTETLHVLKPGCGSRIVDGKKQETDLGPPVEYGIAARQIAEVLDQSGHATSKQTSRYATTR